VLWLVGQILGFIGGGIADAIEGRRTNRLVAAIVLTAMLGMAILGLIWSLGTVEIRRAHDTPGAIESVWSSAPQPAENQPLPLRVTFIFAHVPLVVLLGSLAYVSALLVCLVQLLRRTDRREAWKTRLAVGAAVWVLGLVALEHLAAIGVKTYALLAASAPPQSAPEPPVVVQTPVEVVAPARLVGLGYLPPDTQVVVGLHVAELLQQPAGEDWLRHSGGDPWDSGVALLANFLGMKLDDVDHVVLGLTFDEQPRRLTVVVRTRVPYDEARVRQNLQASGSPAERQGKKLYRLPVEGMLWCADERTLVMVIRIDRKKLFQDDLDQVPLHPAPGSNQLPAELQTVLKERMGPVAQVWAAGHAPDWDVLFEKVPTLTRADRQALAGVRTFAVPVVFSDAVQVSAAFQCRDEAAAKALDRRLEQWGATAPKWRRVEEGSWVTVQTKTDAEAIQDAVRGGAGGRRAR
jgi:hypothetical protein